MSGNHTRLYVLVFLVLALERVALFVTSARMRGVGPFASGTPVSSRFAQLYADSQYAPALPILSEALPREIISTLQAYAINWEDLDGTIQRLLLWDAGFVVSSDAAIARVYVECGITMDDIIISKSNYETAGCPLRSCDDTNLAAGNCPVSSVYEIARCAASPIFSDRRHVAPASVALWSEEQSNSEVPRPTIYRATNETFSIHFQDTDGTPTREMCPEKLRLAIPCVKFSAFDSKWCVPKSTGAVKPLLESIREQTLRMATHTTSVAVPLLWLSALLLIGLSALMLIFSHRKVKSMKRSMDQTMHSKPPAASDNEITATGDDELDYIIINSQEPTVDNSVPLERRGLRRLPSSVVSLSSSNATSSYTDLINASEVLISFQNEPVVLRKRIPMIDIEFGRRLCNGASGEVFLGRVHGQRVAIKQLLRLKTNELDDIECFAREIQLTATLDHPNVIRMIGVAWNTFQNLALILEYRSGGDLLNALRKKGSRWSWNAEKLHIAIGIAKAMVYLHERTHPLVHRDIKSRNILIDASTIEPALCDFGSSRNVSALDLLSTDPTGTVLWSAPEVISAEEHSVKADIYSFGVVLAELDTCTLPFTDERDSDGRPIQAIRIAHLVVEDRIKPILTEHCPRFVRELVMKCVNHKADHRPPATEVLAILSEAADDCAALWKSRSQSLPDGHF